MTPGFAEAVRQLVRELRREGVEPDELDRIARGCLESEAKADDLTALYRRYLEGRADLYDGEDALAVADPARFDGIELLLVGVWRLGAHGRRLIEALAERVPVTVFLPSVGEDADAAHVELRSWLHARGAQLEELAPPAGDTALAHLQRDLFSPTGPAPPDETVDLVSAPDPLTETREAARACLAWAGQGIAFREMVVAYRQAEVYRPLVEAVFTEAGIPVYLDDGPSLAERPLGRRILALLDLIDSPLRRRDVIAFLSDGRMPRETRERFGGAPPARWDSISRRAGVVEGIEQWRSRLDLAPRARSRGRSRGGRPGVAPAPRRGLRHAPRVRRGVRRRPRRSPGAGVVVGVARLPPPPARDVRATARPTCSATSTSSPSSTRSSPRSTSRASSTSCERRCRR